MIAVGVANGPDLCATSSRNDPRSTGRPTTCSQRVRSACGRGTSSRPHPPELHLAGDRRRHARDGDGDHRRRRAWIPGARPAGPSHAGVGNDADERRTYTLDRAVSRAVPGPRDRDHRARLQPDRGRACARHSIRSCAVVSEALCSRSTTSASSSDRTRHDLRRERHLVRGRRRRDARASSGSPGAERASRLSRCSASCSLAPVGYLGEAMFDGSRSAADVRPATSGRFAAKRSR